MDNGKTGKLIKRLRIEKNMTQKDLAEMLHITDRAVSKWERGISAPDISLLEPLSKILDISIPELLSGQETNKSSQVIKLKIPSFNTCLKIGAILLFTWCVILNDSISVRVPSGNYVQYMETGNYKIRRTITQIIHQFPIFHIKEGYLYSLLVASLIITISCIFWTTILCCIIYPRGLTFSTERLNEHISLSKLCSCIILFQLSKVLRPEYSSINLPFSYLFIKQFIGLPIFIITMIFLFFRIKKRISAGESDWRIEVKILLPFFIGLIFIALEFIFVTFLPQWSKMLFISVLNINMSPPEIIITIMLLFCSLFIMKPDWIYRVSLFLRRRICRIN